MQRSRFLILSLVTVWLGMVSPALAEDLFFKNAAQYQRILVKRVVSADTIVLDNNERIRLIGIKGMAVPKTKKAAGKKNEYGFVVVPEVVNPITSLEERAYDYAKDMMEGQLVRLEFDAQKSNENFFTLAYVFTVKDDTFVNAAILSQGYARLQIRPPNTKYADRLRDAYKESRREKRGLQAE